MYDWSCWADRRFGWLGYDFNYETSLGHCSMGFKKKLKLDGLNKSKKNHEKTSMGGLFFNSWSKKSKKITVFLIHKAIRFGPFMSQERISALCLGWGLWGEKICNSQGSKIRKNKVGAVMLSHIGANPWKTTRKYWNYPNAPPPKKQRGPGFKTGLPPMHSPDQSQ